MKTKKPVPTKTCEDFIETLLWEAETMTKIPDEIKEQMDYIVIDGKKQFGMWRKNNEEDKIWWWDDADGRKGPMIFSFDKLTPLNLWTDYKKLKNEEKELFDKENPFWAKFFGG